MLGRSIPTRCGPPHLGLELFQSSSICRNKAHKHNEMVKIAAVRKRGSMRLPGVCTLIYECSCAHNSRNRKICAFTRDTTIPVPPRRKPAPVARECGGNKSATEKMKVREMYAWSTHRRGSLPDALGKGQILLRQCLAPLVPHRASPGAVSRGKTNFCEKNDPM
jgi:hypothetical protein